MDAYFNNFNSYNAICVRSKESRLAERRQANDKETTRIGDSRGYGTGTGIENGGRCVKCKYIATSSLYR